MTEDEIKEFLGKRLKKMEPEIIEAFQDVILFNEGRIKVPDKVERKK